MFSLLRVWSVSPLNNQENTNLITLTNIGAKNRPLDGAMLKSLNVAIVMKSGCCGDQVARQQHCLTEWKVKYPGGISNISRNNISLGSSALCLSQTFHGFMIIKYNALH
jgi:hypothetical protein